MCLLASPLLPPLLPSDLNAQNRPSPADPDFSWLMLLELAQNSIGVEFP